MRDNLKGDGVSTYIHNSLSFTVTSNLCTNSVNIEFFSVENLLNNTHNTLVNVLYRPPNSKIEPTEAFLNFLLFSDNLLESKKKQ